MIGWPRCTHQPISHAQAWIRNIQRRETAHGSVLGSAGQNAVAGANSLLVLAVAAIHLQHFLDGLQDHTLPGRNLLDILQNQGKDIHEQNMACLRSSAGSCKEGCLAHAQTQNQAG